MPNLVAFYGEQPSVEFEGVTYTSEALMNAEETVAEWQIFKRAVDMERDVTMQKNKSTRNWQELKVETIHVWNYLSKHFSSFGHSVDIACWNSYNGTFFQSDEVGKEVNDVNLARLMSTAVYNRL